MCLLNFVLFFQVNYKCNYGETIYVVGNVPGLGNWSFQKGFKLTWSEGHNWTGKLKIIHDNREPIQYKYVIAPTDVLTNPDKLIWERGSNRFIDLYSVSRLTIKLNDEFEHLKVRIAVSADAFKAVWNNSDEVLCYTNLPMRKSPVEMKLKKYSIQGDSKEEMFWAASFYVPYNLTNFNYKLRASNSETKEVYSDLSYRKFNFKKLPYYASLSEHYTVQCSTHTKFDFKLSASFNFDAVTEDICVGSFPRTPQDIDELLANGVKAVLNLQTASDMKKFSIDWESLQQQYQNANITLEHFPIVDMDNTDLSKKVKEAGNLIQKLVREHGKVYVHCTAGKYRSPHAVIFYLWYFKQYKLESAIELIRAKRRKTRINIFEEVFKQGIQIAQRTI